METISDLYYRSKNTIKNFFPKCMVCFMLKLIGNDTHICINRIGITNGDDNINCEDGDNNVDCEDSVNDEDDSVVEKDSSEETIYNEQDFYLENDFYDDYRFGNIEYSDSEIVMENI